MLLVVSWPFPGKVNVITAHFDEKRSIVLSSHRNAFKPDFESLPYLFLASGNININAMLYPNVILTAAIPPTLTVSNGSSVTLRQGTNAHIRLSVLNPDGTDVTVERATGYRTDCLTSLTTERVDINTNNLTGCDIAWVSIVLDFWKFIPTSHLRGNESWIRVSILVVGFNTLPWICLQTSEMPLKGVFI